MTYLVSFRNGPMSREVREMDEFIVRRGEILVPMMEYDRSTHFDDTWEWSHDLTGIYSIERINERTYEAVARFEGVKVNCRKMK